MQAGSGTNAAVEGRACGLADSQDTYHEEEDDDRSLAADAGEAVRSPFRLAVVVLELKREDWGTVVMKEVLVADQCQLEKAPEMVGDHCMVRHTR